jgi:transcriptional regulator with XRE-family HTH domain
MNDIEKKFANAVRRRRKELGLSQEALASKAGIHRTYAGSIERAKVQVSVAVAAQIASALELTLSAFFARVESEKIKP